jgi:hypothetical protein
MTFSKTVSTGNNGLDIFVGSQLVNSSAVYDLEDPLSLLTSANITATSGQVTLVGSSAIVDRSGNSLAPF